VRDGLEYLDWVRADCGLRADPTRCLPLPV